jgi:hypothetical protein
MADLDGVRPDAIRAQFTHRIGVAANAPAGEPGVEVVAVFDVGDAEVPGAGVDPLPVVFPVPLVVLAPPDISAKTVPAAPSSTITIPAMSIAFPSGWLRNPRDDVDDGDITGSRSALALDSGAVCA